MLEDFIFQKSRGGITKRGLQYQNGWDPASKNVECFDMGLLVTVSLPLMSGPKEPASYVGVSPNHRPEGERGRATLLTVTNVISS